MDGELRELARRASDPDVHAGGARPRAAGAAALLSVCLGFFVIQLDVTIVNVALPAIQREIGGSLAGLQWVFDAYTLALARSCSPLDLPRIASRHGGCSHSG